MLCNCFETNDIDLFMSYLLDCVCRIFNILISRELLCNSVLLIFSSYVAFFDYMLVSSVKELFGKNVYFSHV